jgi:4-hydroxy-L-threonine phosphate dehydrogenase PdxA
LNVEVPEIAVAGINPHSGENGLFGSEEINEIIPAIRNMKKKGIRVEGPVPPDIVFLQALKGKYDIVVAMYHDQGHIPLKLLGFTSGVNVTVGLPFVRTSVDHGTAFEIAWLGEADEKSMVEAIKLAIRLSQ